MEPPTLWTRRIAAAVIVAVGVAAFPVGPTAQRVPGSAVTFTRDVAPIVFAQCVGCHRPGAGAPFSLLTYADARPRARLIASITARRLMPPWQPLPVDARFKDERRLSDAELRVIQQWVEGGAPEGDPRDLPSPPVVSTGWHLGEPDLIVSMPEAFEMPARGPDLFRNVVLPVAIPARRYVQAVELRPGNPAVVHHARVMVDDTGESRRLDAADPDPGFPSMDTPGARFPDGYFLGWAHGKVPKREASAWPLDPGTDLVVQLHLRPSGQVERVGVSVGLYFSDTPPTFTPVVLQMGARTLDIAAGDAQYVVTDAYRLPVDATALRIAPHAHYLGRDILVRAVPPSGAAVTLLHIPDWDFNWQDDYDFASPVTLPAGTTVEARFTYDNSAGNRRNPHAPPQRVTFGSQATDEMCELLLQLVPAAPADLDRLRADVRRKTLAIETAEIEKRVTDQPDDVESRLSLGAIYMQAGRWSDGARAFEAAVSMAPEHPVANYNAGQLAFTRRDYDAARRYLERAIQRRPELVEAHVTLAAILEMRGDTAAALEHYRTALALRPGHVPAATNLARTLVGHGSREEAISVLERALRARPGDRALIAARDALKGSK